MKKTTKCNIFFEQIILKNNLSHFNKFEPRVLERKVGGDTFFSIEKDTPHYLINKRIIQFVLSNIPINNSACGFVQGKSYYDFLKPHISGYYFLRLDIKKFFHSILFSEIELLLKDHFSIEKNDGKYSPFDIALMSLTHTVSNTCPDKELVGENILPIGFPSSPVISNILFRRIDILIQKYCENKKIKYSRYADDLLFSSIDSKFLHNAQFEKEISIFISSLALRLKKSKRKECENTISLNGYVIQNKKPLKLLFSSIYKESPIGTLRLSNKKIKVIKKLVNSLNKGSSPVTIMENLFGLSNYKFDQRYGIDYVFYKKYASNQLQNKLKGYRSYLVSLIKFEDKHKCVDESCLKTTRELIEVIEKNIL